MPLTEQDKAQIMLIVLEALHESGELVKRSDYERDKGQIRLAIVILTIITLIDTAVKLPGLTSLLGM